MIITINDKEVNIDGVIYDRKEIAAPQLADELNKYHGSVEYDANVSKMIKWYYGDVRKVSWCAIAVSYICSALGCLSAIGGKHDNVNAMRKACNIASLSGYGAYYEGNRIPKLIKKNDILFWLWSGDTMKDDSSKHVGIAEYDTDTNSIYCVGGNQKDKVCTLKYDRKNLYAIYRIGG